MSRDIAIVAMAGRFPGASDPRRLWENILAGEIAITSLGRAELSAADVASDPAYVAARGVIADPDLFDAAFFGVTEKEAELMDPQHRLLMQTAWETLESGGLSGTAAPDRVALFAGAGFNYYLLRYILTRPDEVNLQGLLAIALGNEKDHLATKIAYRLRLHGPAITVQTACSTSLVAVHLAVQSLRAGDCDLALAGGACIALPQHVGYVYEPRGILSPDGTCRPFDAKAAGTVPGNGVAMVALRRADDALRDGDYVYALIKGSAVNNDGGGKVGYTAPGVAGQADVLRRAYADASVDPASIGYLEAHGTATEVGDAIELQALSQVFGHRTGAPCSLGSVKANLGHLDAAAGVTGLIKAALALHHRQIPPLAGVKQLRTELADGYGPFTVDLVAREWSSQSSQPRRAAVSSFGIGGTNAHVVLEEAPGSPDMSRTVPPGTPAVFIVSARTPEAVRESASRLAEHLAREPDTPVHDVALTLQEHRRVFSHRLAVAVSDIAQATNRLAKPRVHVASRHADPVFLFPGQGAESPGMSAGVYRQYPVVRDLIDHGADLLRDRLGTDLRDVLLGDDPRGLIHRTDVTQPVLVLHEFALASLLMSWGVQPTALIGHSAGEFSAAALAGELAFEDMLHLVALRGRAMQDMPQGAMAVIMAAEGRVRRDLPDDLDLAAVNSPGAVVVAGSVKAVERYRAHLDAGGVESRLMPAQRAFHSRMMRAAATELQAHAALWATRERSIPVISTVDGSLLPAGSGRTLDYWVDQLLRTVRYQDAVATALRLPHPIFVEVGPGTALSGAVSRIPGGNGAVSIALQPRGRARADASDVLGGVGELWAAGVPVAWNSVRTVLNARRSVLPTYPFARTRHWLEPGQRPTAESGTTPASEPGPATDTEVAPSAEDAVLSGVVNLWQRMLGSAVIHPDDDFFSLGGESLLFIRMLSCLRREFGADVPVDSAIDMPTPRVLAARIAALRLAEGGAG